MIFQAVNWGWSEILWVSLIGFALVFVLLVALIFIMKGFGACFQSRTTTLPGKPAIAPQPMISQEEIAAIARFADSLPGVHKIHLLPYHRLGQDKYEGLGREYLMADILPPENEHMEMLKKLVENVSDLEYHIGG